MTGAVASGLMSWPWPGRVLSRPLGSACATACAAARRNGGLCSPLITSPKFPPSRLVEAFGQVVEPLITEITCLRSHEPRLFHLVSAYIGPPPGGTSA